MSVCAAQKGLQELRVRQKGSPVPAHALWQENRLISNRIQTLKAFQFHFSSRSHLKELIFLHRQGTRRYPGVHSSTGHYCCQSFSNQSQHLKLWLQRWSTSHQGSSLPHRNSSSPTESMPNFLEFGSGPWGAEAAVLVAKAESKTATK